MVVGILTLALGTLGSGVFQVLSIQRYWQDDVVATKELRHAGSWFAGDALNAQTTDLIDGAPAVDAVTLSWADGDGNLHTASYELLEDILVRNFDGVPSHVGRKVVSVGFSLVGNLLSFVLEVRADRGETDSISLQTYLRMLR